MNKGAPIIMGLILLALSLWLQLTQNIFIREISTRLDHLFYDLQIRANVLTPKKTIKTPILIIDIDAKSLQKEGHWPWPRWKLANLVNILQQAGSVVIVFDMIFSEPENNIANEIRNKSIDLKLDTPIIDQFLKTISPLYNYDQIFANSLMKMDTILGFIFTSQPQMINQIPAPDLQLKTSAEKSLNLYNLPGILGNIPILQNSTPYAGFINAFADEDGVFRRCPLLIRNANNVYPMLALQAAQVYLLKPVKLVIASYNGQPKLEGIKFNEYVIPTDEKAQILIPFRSLNNKFTYLSATEVLNKNFPNTIFEGKIVFIGSTALGDVVPTPISAQFPGVEIQATITDGILSKNFMYKPAWITGLEVSLTFVLGIILAFACPSLSARVLIFIMLSIIPILMLINNWIMDNTRVLISMINPILASILIILTNIFYNYLFETRHREKIMGIFNQYVPIKHIHKMLKSSSDFGLKGENRVMSVLFADIRSFTTISESLNAIEIKELLNAFFTPMTEIIFRHHGTIDKYVGDLIMAFWGAPLKDKNHAHNALCAALDMQKEIHRLKSIFIEKKWPEIKIGIGINTGLMNVGDMGSKYRRNYTVLGDAVNIASRIESLTKFYGVNILVTQETQLNQKSFLFRRIDKVKTVGKEKVTELYELMCLLSEATPELLDELAIYNQGLNFYFAQQWTKAREIFALLCEQHPNVKLYELYLDRSIEFQQNPPHEPWEGAYIHLRK